MNEIVFLDYTAGHLEREYNNRAKTPEFQDILDDWKARSESFITSQSGGNIDLPYGSQARQRLDLFMPPSPIGAGAPAPHPATTAPPLHVFFHGGYWQFLDKETFNFLAPAFVNSGTAFANVEYTLCPEASMQDIVEQSRQAMAFLYRQANEYGYDNRRIQVSGHSAGGHLAAMLASTDWPAWASDLPGNLISSVIPVSGIFDLEPLRHIPIGEPLQLTDKNIRQLSPAFGKFPAATKMIIALGALEGREFHRQAEELARHCRNQGMNVSVRSVQNRNHFTILEDIADPDSELSVELRALNALAGA